MTPRTRTILAYAGLCIGVALLTVGVLAFADGKLGGVVVAMVGAVIVAAFAGLRVRIGP